MKKQLIQLIICLGALTMMPVARAQFSYSVTNGAATITGYNTAAGLNAVIPASTNGYPVVSIGTNALYDSSITNVVIPTSVTNIDIGAFLACGNLTSLSIPNSVTTIGSAAFENCFSLISVSIPNSVTTINAGTFSGCISLTNVTFLGNAPTPANDTSVFQSDPSAVAYYNAGTTGWGGTFDGIPTVMAQSPLAAFSYITNSGAVTITGYSTPVGGLNALIPASINGYPVVGIAQNAFENSTITNVLIPNSVTTVGAGAFAYCSGLMNVAFPDSVTDIGGDVIYNSSVTNVTLGSGITTLGTLVFANCSLRSVTIPDSVTSIQYQAFYSSQLTSVIIPGSVSSIGMQAFSTCPNLTSVTIFNSSLSIGSGAFSFCVGLTNVTFPGNAPTPANDTSVFQNDSSAVAYYNAGTTGWDSTFDGIPTVMIPSPWAAFNFYTNNGAITITGYNPDGSRQAVIPAIINGYPVVSIGDQAFFFTSLTNVTIPNGVTNIGFDAFAGSALTSMIIPGSVTAIGGSAFFNDYSLTNVTFLGNAPATNTSVFLNDSAAVAYYYAGATGWGSTFDGIPAVMLSAMGSAPPPALGISTYGGGPAIFFPTATGTNFILQMTTNLASGNWVTVSNVMPITGVVVTNPPPNAYFRLH